MRAIAAALAARTALRSVVNAGQFRVDAYKRHIAEKEWSASADHSLRDSECA